MNMLRVGVLISLAMLVLLAACTRKNVAPGDKGPTDSALKPDSEVSGATIFLYDREVVQAEIHSKLMRRFEAIDSTVAYTLDVDFHDSLGAVTSNLIADSGVIREKDDRMEVFGKVVVLTQDSTRLDTDFLRWNPKRHKIESESFVKFTRRTDIMTGWGMEADPDLGRLKILSQVSGSVSETEIKSDSL